MEQAQQPNSNYRPDIDGLRALAVLSVVLFHAFPKWIHGGFIGVDIFFVISGYLISSIILKDLESESFSFSDFYIRRVKRIFPALILVLLSSLVFGWFALLSDEYQQLGKHTFGASTFTNNFMFWQESGYFDNDSNTKPLLHLWSLSIEEQFYLLWPFLLWIFFKWKTCLGKILLSLIISFTLLHFLVFYSDRIVSFYAPYARFFELLVGAYIAYQHLHPKHKSIHPLIQRFKSIQSFVGLGLILIGIQIIHKESHFPGWYALLSPVLGAALIINSSQDSLINKHLLSNKVVIWIGLISYPLYLWHWPLLSFGSIVASQTPLLGARIALVALAFILATLTYYFVEKPIRFGNTKTSKQKAFLLILSMVVIGAIGGVIYKEEGFKERDAANPIVKHQGDLGNNLYSSYVNKNYYACDDNLLRESIKNFGVRCFQSKKDQPIDIAIIGDSHAEHLFVGLAEAMPKINIMYYSGVYIPNENNPEFKSIYTFLFKNQSIKKVIISAYWKNRLGNIPKNSELSKELIFSIKKLQTNHKEIYITDDTPNFSFSPKLCKYIRPLSNSNNCEENKSYFYYQYEKYITELNKIHQVTGATIINTAKILCSDNDCTMQKNGKVLYSDVQHLNILGSRYVANEVINSYKLNIK